MDNYATTRNGVVLAFDQSLARTGWALVDLAGNEAHVLQVGMSPTEPGDETGFEDSFVRGTQLFDEVRDTIKRFEQVSWVVHEMPSARMSPQTRNREAPFVAATAVRCAVSVEGKPCYMLNAQKVKKRLAGNPSADKKDVREALLSMSEVKGLDRGNLDYWNDDVFDAVALAVVFGETKED